MSPWLGSQRHRLVGGPALRLRRRARCHDHPHGDFADGDRRQSRPFRRVSLPRPGDHRALPDYDVRRRATLSSRHTSPTRPRSSDAGTLVRPLSRRRYRPSSSGCAACTRRSSFTTATRSARRFHGCSTGILPHFNIGTNDGASCAPELTAAVEAACDATSFTASPTAGSGAALSPGIMASPQAGVHAIQMEIACRGYLAEPSGLSTRRTGLRLLTRPMPPPMAAAISARLASLRSRSRPQLPEEPLR